MTLHCTPWCVSRLEVFLVMISINNQYFTNIYEWFKMSHCQIYIQHKILGSVIKVAFCQISCYSKCVWKGRLLLRKIHLFSQRYWCEDGVQCPLVLETPDVSIADYRQYWGKQIIMTTQHLLVSFFFLSFLFFFCDGFGVSSNLAETS